MRQKQLAMAAVAALLSATPALAKDDDAPSKRFTAERVFDMEYATDPQVSPDGKTVVYVRHSMDKMTDRDTGHLWSIDLESGAHRPLVTDVAAGRPRWSPDGSRIIYMSSNGEGPEMRLLYLDSGRSFSLFVMPCTSLNATPMQAPHSIAFGVK